MGLTQKLHRKKTRQSILVCYSIKNNNKEKNKDPEAKLIEGCSQNSGENTTENDQAKYNILCYFSMLYM